MTYSMVQWLCLISWRLLVEECHTSDNESAWNKDWPHKIYVGQWPIFCGPVILLNIFKTIWCRNVILGIVDQCDTKIDFRKYMHVIDLYFAVQRFCLISWRLLDGSVWHNDWPDKVYVGQWPVVHGPVILHISWRSVSQTNCFEILNYGTSQGYLFPSGQLL